MNIVRGTEHGGAPRIWNVTNQQWEPAKGVIPGEDHVATQAEVQRAFTAAYAMGHYHLADTTRYVEHEDNTEAA